MNWSSVLLSGILGGICGGVAALLAQFIPGVRGTKAARYAAVVGAVVGVGVEPLVAPLVARYTGSTAALAVIPKMTPSEVAEFEAALKAQGIKSGPAAQAFGAKMAATGLVLLDDEQLVSRRQLLARMLSPDDDRACAALVRGDVSALSAGIERLTPPERTTWGELSKEAALRAIRNTPPPSRASSKSLESMVKVYVAGSTADDQRRFGAIALHPETASDAEMCWFGRFLGTRAAVGRREVVASVERALVPH
jgi:hypothetical protein